MGGLQAHPSIGPAAEGHVEADRHLREIPLPQCTRSFSVCRVTSSTSAARVMSYWRTQPDAALNVALPQGCINSELLLAFAGVIGACAWLVIFLLSAVGVSRM